MEYSPFSSPVDDEPDHKKAERFSDTEEDDDDDEKLVRKTWFVGKAAMGEEPKKSEGLFESLRKKEAEVKKAEEGPKPAQEATPDQIELPDNPENLTDGEVVEISQQIVDTHAADLAQEVAEQPAGSPESTEAAAAAVLVEAISERVAEGQPITEQLLDESFEEAAAEMQLDEEQPAATEQDAETGEQVSVETEDEAEDAPPQPIAAGSSGTSGAGAPPVVPPIPPTPPQPPFGGGAGGSGGMSPGPSFGQAAGGGLQPPTPSFNTLSQAAGASQEALHSVNERHLLRRGLLVGGVVGYLVGRRRGRIKTEEKLLPIQKSLEAQVKDLDEKVSIKEQQMRGLVAEKYARENDEAKARIAERVAARQHAKLEARAAQTARVAVESQPDQPAALPRDQYPQKLANVVLPKAERVPAHAEQTPVKNIESMNDAELFRAAAAIEVGGKSLRAMYEQGRLSKQDLKELLYENDKGGYRLEELFYERLRTPEEPVRFERFEKQNEQDPLQTVAQSAASVAIPAASSQNVFAEQHKLHNDLQAVPLLAETAPEESPASPLQQNYQLVATMVVLGLGISLLIALLLF